jgi:Tfp pilus assembly protein PilF
MTEHGRRNRILLLISAGLVAATIIAYEPVRRNGFIGYDDDKYITKNPDISGGITCSSVIQVFTQSHSYMWHPLTTFSHMLDCEIFGLNPLWHHFVGLLLHIINALLLFWILTNLTNSVWASAFVAGVFALHPLQVESVAWAAERKTVLSGLFWFLTMAVYVWYTKKPGIWRYIAVFAIYGLSIITKPVVVTLPLVLLLLDYWPLNRLSILRLRSGQVADCPLESRRDSEDLVPEILRISRGRLPNEKRKYFGLICEKIPLLIMSIVLSVITVIAQKSGGVIARTDAVPLAMRIANMFVSYISYIGKMIWPVGLPVFYPYSITNFKCAKVIICTLLFLLITAMCIYAGRKRRYAAMGWLWFAGTLIPVIGIVQAGAQAMANRYMYIPMLGLLIIIAWSIKELIANYPGLKYVAVVFAAAILFIAVVLTRMQVKHWENDLTLFGYALKVTDKNFLAESNYGMALLEKQRPREAETHFKNAIQYSPGFADAYSNLGTVYILLGQNEEAVKNLTKAIELKSDNTKALNNYAWLLATQKEISAENAAKSVELAFRACELTKNKDPELLDTLAVAYASAGRFADAIKTAEQAVVVAKITRQEKLVNEIQSRIKLYQSGQRYYQK